MRKAILVSALLGLTNVVWAVQVSQVAKRVETKAALGAGGTALLDLTYRSLLPQGEAKVDFRIGKGQIPREAMVLLPLDGRTRVVRKVFTTTDPSGLTFVLDGPGGSIPLRVSGPLRGVNWAVRYRALVSSDEKQILELSGVCEVTNQSGLDLPEADLFLPDGSSERTALKAGEKKHIAIGLWRSLPVRKTYTLDIQKRGKNPVVKYKFRSPLSDRALLPGTVRVYIATEGGERLLCTSRLKRVPPNGEAEMEIGTAPDIVGKRYLLSFRKDEHWEHGRLCWTTTREAYKVEVENRRKESIVISVLERIPDYWRIVKSNIPPKKKDAHTVEFEFTVPAGGKAWVEYELERFCVGPRRVSPIGPYERLVAK